MTVLILLVLGCGGEPAPTSSEQPDATAETDRSRGGKVRRRRRNRPDGKWRLARSRVDDDGLTDEQRETIAQLESIGYADGSRDVEANDVVTVYDPKRAFDGVNLFCSGHEDEAYLVDMEGNTLHTWRSDFDQIFPDHPAREGAPGTHHYRRTHLLDDGDLMVIYEGRGIARLGRDSTVKWSWDKQPHHDVHVEEDGTFWVLSRQARVLPDLAETPILEDHLVHLSADGEILQSIGLIDAYTDTEYDELWKKALPKPDVFHTNSIERLDGRAAEHNPAFAKGNLLISHRNSHLIAVVDPETEKVVWASTGVYRKQHDATITDDGTMLVFDNMGPHAPKQSRVLEYDLSDMSVVWTFESSDAVPFWSATLGTNQRLPNGNTLIAESDGGRALEVTSAGEVVWEFYNPHRAGTDDRFIAALFHMDRIPWDQVAWLRE